MAKIKVTESKEETRERNLIRTKEILREYGETRLGESERLKETELENERDRVRVTEKHRGNESES